MNDVQQRAAAKHFAEYWQGKGYEKGQCQPFWLSLLADVFGVEHAAEYIRFEDQVHLDNTSFIDAYIPETHVLIEQKSLGKDLSKPIRQSDGTLLKPIQQAQRYASVLPYSQRPRWIVICNFERFHVYDMEHPQADPVEIQISELPMQYYLLDFLTRKQDKSLQREMEISIKAGEIVGKLYDALLKEYIDPTDEHSLKSLNALCVRLVFCLYAEDAGIFGRRLMFHDWLQKQGLNGARQSLIELFKVLDTKTEDRDPYMDEDLLAFPYVNGGLFSDENIEIPRINQTIYDLLLDKASAAFDWSEISPTIFGAVFESTLNPETRRSGGMHYTSIENIHKVIDPLFLDALKAELEEIKTVPVQRTQELRLKAFQDKLASLKFLDPAAGSGNFLTESYLWLRRLENEVIDILQHGQVSLGLAKNPIKVSIGQFYGIEINDFAASVAKTALWIAESQMMKRTEDIVHMPMDFLPLKSYANIVCANALRIDWNDVVPKEELNYIMGNPPFVAKTGRQSAEGHHSAAIMSVDQKADKELFFGKNAGLIDYVACWYKKASEYTKNTDIISCFVSTSSICQGQQVEPIWSTLLEDGIVINYAYTTFKWVTEAAKGAYVFVVIVAISHNSQSYSILFDGGSRRTVKAISPYLIEGDPILIATRNKPICNVPEIGIGNKPIDGGNYLFKKDEMLDFLRQEPPANQYFHLWYGADEFINSHPRYCLWLGDCSPAELRKMPHCLKRVQAVREYRLASPSPGTVRIADKPTRFHVENMPKGNYIVIPEVSSGARRYIPMGYMDDSVMCGNTVRLMPNATLYHLGILTSNVHMAWMRTVGGYFGPSYRYSVNVVYNNFPWPEPTEEQKAKIEQTAQGILDARALYPDSSLADLYDELTMPPELRRAHQLNDRAVWEAYGKAWDITSESECVAHLMKLYQSMTAAETNA